jgi:hypothetical protein
MRQRLDSWVELCAMLAGALIAMILIRLATGAAWLALLGVPTGLLIAAFLRVTFQRRR